MGLAVGTVHCHSLNCCNSVVFIVSALCLQQLQAVRISNASTQFQDNRRRETVGVVSTYICTPRCIINIHGGLKKTCRSVAVSTKPSTVLFYVNILPLSNCIICSQGHVTAGILRDGLSFGLVWFVVSRFSPQLPEGFRCWLGIFQVFSARCKPGKPSFAQILGLRGILRCGLQLPVAIYNRRFAGILFFWPCLFHGWVFSRFFSAQL